MFAVLRGPVVFENWMLTVFGAADRPPKGGGTAEKSEGLGTLAKTKAHAMVALVGPYIQVVQK